MSRPARCIPCPESDTEDTVLFIRVEGSNINFTEDGQFHSVLDAVAIRYLTEQRAAAEGVGQIGYFGGGAAGLMSEETD